MSETKRLRGEKRKLICKLSEDEVNERGVQLARVVGKIEEVEGEKSVAIAEFKARLKPLEKQHHELGAAVRGKAEERDVDCEWSADFRSGRAYLHRTDTDERIDSRPLTDDERQGRLSIAATESMAKGIEKAKRGE